MKGIVVDTRLALFIPSLRGGGAERVILNLARGFAQRGMQVDLVLAKAEGRYLSHIPPSVRVVDLDAPRVLSSLPGLVRYFRQERPTILLSAMDHANVVALSAKGLSAVPVRVVVSVHNTLSQVAAHATSLRTKLLPRCVQLFYPWAQAVVAVSHGVAEDLVRLSALPPSKIHVIYNPVVTPELVARAQEPLTHPWFAPGEPPVILGVGRLTAQKDFSTLIRAFSLVRKERPARLIILGEGEDRPHLEALVNELGLEADVALPGFVDNPYNYMNRARVFVLSSRWEGLPTVLIEALAAGAPGIVSTDCPSGPSEILQEGKLGTLVPVGNIQAMATAILRTLSMQPRSPGVLHTALRPYTVDGAIEQYLGVFRLEVTRDVG